MTESFFNIEVGLISKLIETGDMLTVKESQITSSFFKGENKRVINYIFKTFMDIGSIPTERAITQKFSGFNFEHYENDNGEEIVGTEETLKYWCKELRIKVKHNKLADTLEKAVKELEDFNTEEAYSYLKKQISYIENEIVESSTVDITKDTNDRVEAYLERKKNQGMLGIPTGINGLDFCLKGLQKETLTTVIANTSVGKTWFEILVGAYCQLQNYKVVHFVTEMPESVMRDRYEAMLFSMMYGSFNYGEFKSGRLTSKAEKQYFSFLKNDLPTLEPLYIKTAMGVMGIAAEIESIKPDIVLIDGVYLMEDDQGAKDDWLRVAHITRDLKRLTKRLKVPILINTQADKNTSKKVGPNLEDIMYTQSIGQDSDNVIALYRDELMINDKEMGIKVLKQREGTLSKVLINWDFSCMDFSDIYHEEPSSDSNSVNSSVIGIDACEDDE